MITGEALDLWIAPRRISRGGQSKYSDLAITTCLTLSVVCNLPLRQTQGLMLGIAKLIGLNISVPDFSTLSRRSEGLNLPAKPQNKRTEPILLVVPLITASSDCRAADSTGLKVFGEGEWLQNKHQTKAKRRSWRKLHLGLNLLTGEIVCADLTKDDVGDPTVLPELLDQLDGTVSWFFADGAYDGAPTSDLLIGGFGETVEIIIPPPKNATFSSLSTFAPTLRDRHIAGIQTFARMGWQSSSGYNQRSRVETQMGRWKAAIGPKLKARSFKNQPTEAKIGVSILNKMTELGRPKFEVVN